MVKIIGAQAHLRRLRALTDPRAINEIGQGLFLIGDMVRVEAQHSITEGAISGPAHIPSLPGEPPNADTHQLDSNIVTEKVGPLQVNVESRAPYSLPLEVGTSKMAARPFMRPAAKIAREQGPAVMARIINRILRRSR